ncbi:glutamate-rich WD repeat-containing protein 1 [Ananas comosus]|uniref:Glutamate-rich WD repeat-containing protein 1 n=1 Tax=Ananas comosus TaxID=4615 RepID=A0A6P5G2T7_ANACO|nr:glutamate-rich WD repeat-containing protein 1 [Ananas comosus]
MVRSIKNPKKSKRKNKGSKKGEAAAAAAASSSSSVPSAPAKVWQPGVDNLEEGEELQFDPSAYNYLRGFNIGWPCLSYDIVHDSLGLVRTEFPHTVYGVAGTQAEQSSWNYIGIFKLSNIKGKKRDLVPAASADNDADMQDSDSSSDEDDDEDESNDASKPILQLHKVAHQGCVNRIRCMIQKPHICVTWADIGNVQVWDFSSYLNALAESETAVSRGDNSIHRHSPIIKFTGHKDEGYAIDWSPVVTGRLVSGDCNKCIHLWEPTSDTWNVDGNPFVGHTASVEDLQWSPTEADVFASCSVDGTISIWDTRLGRSPAVSFKAHDADVNVISWNRLASCMIASGSDDGSFSIRDLRLIKGDSLVAHFTYHKQPVTSIEWSPHEASTLAVSSADHQLTIWDLSLERDEEEEAEFKEKMKEQANAPEDLPPQLLFVHQGQKDLKELHWHPQIPGMIISTAADGFNVLMPSNIETTLPSAAT